MIPNSNRPKATRPSASVFAVKKLLIPVSLSGASVEVGEEVGVGVVVDMEVIVIVIFPDPASRATRRSNVVGGTRIMERSY